jgi:hypothetical protein
MNRYCTAGVLPDATCLLRIYDADAIRSSGVTMLQVNRPGFHFSGPARSVSRQLAGWRAITFRRPDMEPHFRDHACPWSPGPSRRIHSSHEITGSRRGKEGSSALS